MSLRILLCTHAPSDPRVAVYRSQLSRAEYIGGRGHQVDVVTPGDLLSFRIPRLDPFVLPVVLACRDLTSYDVIVFHSYLGWAFHLMRMWPDPRRRVATITAFHGLEPLYLRALAAEGERSGRPLSWRFRLMHAVVGVLTRLSCRRSDAVFCLNSLESDYLTRHGWASAERTWLMVNGVEAECFVTRAPRQPRRLLFVGQWLPGKGTRYLVEAFVALAAGTDLELACIGTRVPAEAVLSSFPADVRGRVIVVPDVDRPALHEQLSKADLFVFPTLSEGFSLALLEAMAAGLPVVATPAGAAVDILSDGHNALVVPCADSAAIVGAVRRLLTDAGLRQRLATAARDTAARHTLEAAELRFMEAIVAIVSRHQRALINEHRAGEDVVS